MADYPISIDAVRNMLLRLKYCHSPEYIDVGICMALHKLEGFPQMDVATVTYGKWDTPVEHGLPYAANHLGVVCSYCCKWSDNDYNYCPNCGAKMDGGAEG